MPIQGVQGISHITFIVKDLARTATFFRDGLGAVEVYDSVGKNFSQSREKFFTLGETWLAIMEGESPTQRSYRHLAFKINEADLEDFEERLLAIGVEVKAPRPRIPGEGRSLYFYDFDNHLFELHTGTLEDRLKSYAAS
jgi:fosfomycin resistance protein FosX